MNHKNISLIAFVALAIIQLAIPAWMIMHREDIKTNGKEYFFKCRPIDPNDPFRGKYITLGFEAERVTNTNGNKWQAGDAAYASLSTDVDNYAIVKNLSKTPPTSGDYIAVVVLWANPENDVQVTFPFDRYYMEETKAPKAESIYRESFQNAEVVAVVNVLNGNALLKSVLIDRRPIEDVVEDFSEE